MSYGPPPGKTAYGDQDFIKEDWNPQQSSLPQNQNYKDPYQAKPLAPYQPGYQSGASQQPLTPGERSGGVRPPIAGQPGQAPNQLNLQSIAETARTITQDDILFLRSWRQDSFFYRVLPLTAVTTGAYFYYNQTKQLPHKISRYVLLGIACYFVGKMSYRNEFKRRLEASPLNTPYMQAMRNMMGVQTIPNSGFISETNTDFTYGNTGGFGSGGLNEPKFPSTSFEPQGPASNFGQYNNQPSYSTDNGPTNAYEGESKPAASYEELRARNRGFIPK